eukprot:scaffold214470_cov48-Attheya_sp.AAC.4
MLGSRITLLCALTSFVNRMTFTKNKTEPVLSQVMQKELQRTVAVVCYDLLPQSGLSQSMQEQRLLDSFHGNKDDSNSISQAVMLASGKGLKREGNKLIGMSQIASKNDELKNEMELAKLFSPVPDETDPYWKKVLQIWADIAALNSKIEDLMETEETDDTKEEEALRNQVIDFEIQPHKIQKTNHSTSSNVIDGIMVTPLKNK